MKTYVSTLKSYYNKINANNIDFFSEIINDVLHNLKEVESNKRKTLLSALFILTLKPDYQTRILSDCKEVNDKYKQATSAKSNTR